MFTKYIRTLGLTFCFCALTFCLLVLFQIGGPTRSSAWVSDLYRIKTEIASSIEEPKLVLVGGSDVLFGINCQTIEAELDVPCVNGGTHAGLDTRYILHAARPWLQPGDTALLSLPYDLYTTTGTLRDILIDYVLAHDPGYLRSLRWTDRIPFFTGVTFARLLEGYEAKVSPPPPDTASRYQAKNLNQYGDETINLQPERAQAFASDIEQLSFRKTNSGYLESSYGMDEIRAFTNWCQQQNVRLLITYPNTLWFDEYKEDSQKAFFRSIEDFHKSLDVPIVGEYEDFLYDKSMMFDTEYHLNVYGVRKRTKKIIQSLKTML